jgi:MSHA biogenesis protein MshP
LVAALFLVVVLALVGAIMLRLVGVEGATASLSLRSARAYHAARSGVEWGAHQVAASGVCPAPTTLSLTQAGVRGFSVVVTCTSSVHVDSVAPTSNYNIVATASAGTFGTPEFVSRRVQGTISDAP